MIEILAPAGNMESLTAALRCGADAVYTGGKSFSARQNAQNFDFDEMKQAIDLCHLYNAKLYIAVNTILMDEQFDEFVYSIKKYAQLSPDAFIVQDMGAAYIIQNITNIPIHASTQMTIHSVNGAKTALELGFSRVVISREADEKTIREISALGIETEVFVHGALCMSVSGQCYMSAMIGSRSANRGLCAQSCRLPFSASKDTEEHCLSLKDLCLAEHIDKIKASGVTSLKIEGRMKRPEYVAAAVTAYKNAVSGINPDVDTLKAVFSRSGFTDGYFTAQKRDMFGMREKDDVLSANAVIPELKQLYRKERKVSVLDFDISIKKDTPISVTAYDNSGYKASVSGIKPETAINRSVTKDMIEKQFSKLGDTIYQPGKMNIILDESLSVPMSEFNSLRRCVIEKLYAERIRRDTTEIKDDFCLKKSSEVRKNNCRKLRIRVENIDLLKEADLSMTEYIIVPMYNISEKISLQNIKKEQVIIEPPRFICDERKIISRLEELYALGYKHLMCTNISFLKTGKDIGFILHGDFGMNISNSLSVNNISDAGFEDITLSFEMKFSQIKKLSQEKSYGIIAYGKLPLMLTVNCPIKNSVGCKKCNHSIIDRTGREFYVKCSYDYTEIFNSDSLYLADKLDEIPTVSFITLYFTNETASQTKKIINEYSHGCTDTPSVITRGLYFRGIK